MAMSELKDPTSKKFTRSQPFTKSSRRPGRVWRERWSRARITARRSYKGSGRLAGRKALITGGDLGMGRAAAIAFAREGADVAINYFPTEESDAQEVIALKADASRWRSPATSGARRFAGIWFVARSKDLAASILS